MKTSFLILGLLSCVFYAKSQNLNNQNIKVSYLRYPTEPLPEDITTYSKQIYISSLPAGQDRGDITSQISKHMTLPGYDLIDEDGDIKIKVSHYNFSVTDINPKSEQKESKDKDGKVTKWTNFWYTFSYKYPMKLQIINTKTGDYLFDSYVNGSQDYSSGESPKTQSRDAAKKKYSGAISTIRTNTKKTNLSDIKNYIQKTYGYTPSIDYVLLKTVKKFKKYEYPVIDEGVGVAKAALSALEPVENYITEDFKSSMEQAIELFNQQLKEADFDNKKARINEKVASALYNNIALCYYWINEFDKCREAILNAQSLKASAWRTTVKSELNAKEARYTANGLL